MLPETFKQGTYSSIFITKTAVIFSSSQHMNKYGC